MLDSSSVTHLAETFPGRLIPKTDPDYDNARKVYNAMIDKHPYLIARCTNVADVIAALRFGREHALDTAIRGDGHNGPGLALADNGSVIDLSALQGIRVDPKA